ncbi:MAG: hypothetical protein IT230_03895 [Flavobacteriales bacterium]|nr:hypothetical protein [Flavobacteriales bacterium]
MKILIHIYAKIMASVMLMEGKNDNWYVVIDSLFKLLIFILISILPFVIGLLYVFDIAENSQTIANISFIVPAIIFILMVLFFFTRRNEIYQERDLILANEEDKVRTRKYANRVVSMALCVFAIEFIIVASYFMLAG